MVLCPVQFPVHGYKTRSFFSFDCSTVPLPVMAFIYGGSYVLGSGEMYPSYALALHGDMIVVNFNYRVSTLGWLSTGQ